MRVRKEVVNLSLVYAVAHTQPIVSLLVQLALFKMKTVLSDSPRLSTGLYVVGLTSFCLKPTSRLLKFIKVHRQVQIS